MLIKSLLFSSSFSTIINSSLKTVSRMTKCSQTSPLFASTPVSTNPAADDETIKNKIYRISVSTKTNATKPPKLNEAKCAPKTNLVFLKTHKTASSTVQVRTYKALYGDIITYVNIMTSL